MVSNQQSLNYNKYMFQPLLKIPTVKALGFRNNLQERQLLTLEETIKANFGEEGLTCLNDYNLCLNVPTSDSDLSFVLPFSSEGDLKQSGRDVVIGKKYHLFLYGVRGIKANDACMEFNLGFDNRLFLSLTLDLNPKNVQCRYLELLFEYHQNLNGF